MRYASYSDTRLIALSTVTVFRENEVAAELINRRDLCERESARFARFNSALWAMYERKQAREAE